MSDERNDRATEPNRPPSARGGRRGRATRPMHPERPCLNCGDPRPGEYCPNCGQRKVDVRVSLRAMLMELVEDQLTLDQRLPRTLKGLLFKPGHLTVEYVNGRIVRYIHPFRLYLVTSIVFFLLLSFFSLQLVRRAMDRGPDDASIETVSTEGLDSATQRMADLGVALRQIEQVTGDTTIPAPVREAVATNRSAIERELEIATAQRDSLLEDTLDVGPDAGDRGAGDGDLPLRERFGWDDDPPSVQVGFPAADSALSTQVDRIGAMTLPEAAETLLETFFNYVPTMMFILLPVFAGVLKLLYIRRRRFYAEHFIFLLHVHSMVFILAAVMLLLRTHVPAWTDAALILWILIYIYLAMKRVYGQGWLKTFVKYWTLGWMYFWIISISIPFAFIATLLLF